MAGYAFATLSRGLRPSYSVGIPPRWTLSFLEASSAWGSRRTSPAGPSALLCSLGGLPLWLSRFLLVISPTGSSWRRGGMLAMSPVLEEDHTGSPWYTVLLALVGPDLHYSLYVILALGLQSSSSGDFSLSSPLPYLRHLLSFTFFYFY